MLLLAAKTSGKGHIVGEKIELFYEETTDLVSANVIPLVHRLGLLCCASALPNHWFSKLLNTAINIAVNTRHGGRISWPLRQSQHGGVDVETLKERELRSREKFPSGSEPNIAKSSTSFLSRVLGASNPVFLH